METSEISYMFKTRYLIRLDDACPYMDRVKWQRMENILDKYGVKPLVGIIPANADLKTMIDPDDKHHLIIEPSEAIIVRKIFDMALEGKGRIKICKYLNENGILCRKEIQRRNKRKLTLEPFDIESRYLWGTTTIGRLLSSETYIGNLEQLKTKRATFGVEKFVTKDKDDWIKSAGPYKVKPLMMPKAQKIFKSLLELQKETNEN